MPDTSLSWGFYLQSAAHDAASRVCSPLPCAPDRAGQAVLEPSHPWELHGAFPAQALWSRKFELPFMWSDALWKPLTSSQFLPPTQAHLEWASWFQSSPWWARTKSMPYVKTKTRWFPRGQKIFVTWKSIATCQFPIPFIFMHLSKLLTLHIRKYCPRINLLLGDTLNIKSEPRVNIHGEDMKLWKQDLITVMLT